MNDIVEIGLDTVTTGAGALYIDVAKELEKRDLQFFVNVELGNLSLGSAATGGTKDASMPGEFGQVCSYAAAIKMVTPDGGIVVPSLRAGGDSMMLYLFPSSTGSASSSAATNPTGS